MADMESLYGESQSRGRRAAAGRALAVFLLVMAALSIANRALNELTTPAVTEAKVQRGALEKRIDAEGQIEAASEQTVFAPVGARVSAVHVRSGQQVKKGDALFTLDPDALADLAETAQRELTKLKNDREKAAGSLEGAPSGAEVQAAERALERAKRDLETKRLEQDRAVTLKQSEFDAAKAKYDDALSAYEIASADAYAEYKKEKQDDRSEAKKTLEDKRQAFDWAKADISKWTLDKYADCQDAVRDAQVEYDAALAKQQDAQSAYDGAIESTGEKAAASALKKAIDLTDDKKGDLDKAIRSRDGISGIRDYLTAKQDLARAQQDYATADVAFRDACSKTLEVVRAIEQKCDAQKSTLDTAKADIDAKTTALDTAKLDRDAALTEAERKVEDAEDALFKAQTELRQKQLDVDNADADIAEKQDELNRLADALAANGVVTAPVAGQITECDLEPGKAASTDEAGVPVSRRWMSRFSRTVSSG
jgi:multidrug resistance efflux pump